MRAEKIVFWLQRKTIWLVEVYLTTTSKPHTLKHKVALKFYAWQFIIQSGWCLPIIYLDCGIAHFYKRTKFSRFQVPIYGLVLDTSQGKDYGSNINKNTKIFIYYNFNHYLVQNILNRLNTYKNKSMFFTRHLNKFKNH